MFGISWENLAEVATELWELCLHTELAINIGGINKISCKVSLKKRIAADLISSDLGIYGTEKSETRFLASDFETGRSYSTACFEAIATGTFFTYFKKFRFRQLFVYLATRRFSVDL